MLANLATSLFEHDRITTTEARPSAYALAERLVTFAKRGDLAARRRVLTVVRDKGVVHRLFTEIAVDMQQRPGGYTRVTKIGNRKGTTRPWRSSSSSVSPSRPNGRPSKEAEAATKRSAAKPAARAAAGHQRRDFDGGGGQTAASAPSPLVDGGFGADSAAPLEDSSGPEGFTVKGNKDSMKYHHQVPWYDATIAEVWFRTSEAAEAAGFEPAGGEGSGRRRSLASYAAVGVVGPGPGHPNAFSGRSRRVAG